MLFSLGSHNKRFLLSDDIDCSLHVVFLCQSQRNLPIEIKQQSYISHSIHRIHTVLNVLQILDQWNYLLLCSWSQMLQACFKLFEMIACILGFQKSRVYFVQNLLRSNEGVIVNYN